MKRLVDALIFLIVAAAAAVLVFFVLNRNKTTDGNGPGVHSGSAGPSSAPSGWPTAEAELARLNDDQLQGLLTRPDELPGAIQGSSPSTARADMGLGLADMMKSWPEAANRFQQILDYYSWHTGAAIRFDACPLHRSVDMVQVEVYQLPSTSAARTLVDDPALRGFFTVFGAEPAPAENLHGWYLSSVPLSNGECYADEFQDLLVFDYWGLIFVIEADTQSTADPGLARSIMEPLASPLIARVDALNQAAFAPTPVPAEQVRLMTETTSLADLGAYMPTLIEIGVTGSTHTLNQEFSHSYTLDEIVENYRGLNTGLADAIAQAGRTYGLNGQEVRLWDTGNRCPSILGLSIEVDVALFERPAGAEAYMNDANLQQAWASTGLLTTFTPESDGILMLGQVPGHHCGPIRVVGKMVPFERLLITVVVNAYQDVEQQEVIDILRDTATFIVANLYMSKLPGPGQGYAS
jgi:hypothetical protein